MKTEIKCDYISCAKTMGYIVECKPTTEPNGCPRYGNCLPVVGIRETPAEAIGEHTREKGQYYHNILNGGD